MALLITGYSFLSPPQRTIRFEITDRATGKPLPNMVIEIRGLKLVPGQMEEQFSDARGQVTHEYEHKPWKENLKYRWNSLVSFFSFSTKPTAPLNKGFMLEVSPLPGKTPVVGGLTDILLDEFRLPEKILLQWKTPHESQKGTATGSQNQWVGAYILFKGSKPLLGKIIDPDGAPDPSAELAVLQANNQYPLLSSKGDFSVGYVFKTSGDGSFQMPFDHRNSISLIVASPKGFKVLKRGEIHSGQSIKLDRWASLTVQTIKNQQSLPNYPFDVRSTDSRFYPVFMEEQSDGLGQARLLVPPGKMALSPKRMQAKNPGPAQPQEHFLDLKSGESVVIKWDLDQEPNGADR